MQESSKCTKRHETDAESDGKIKSIIPAAPGWRFVRILTEFPDGVNTDEKENSKQPFLWFDHIVAWALVIENDECGCVRSSVRPLIYDEWDLSVPYKFSNEKESRIAPPGDECSINEGGHLVVGGRTT